MTKGQSSIEFLLALPVVFILTIFIAGEFSSLSKTTVALATVKESFYEKASDLNQNAMTEKLEYLVCGATMNINLQTLPQGLDLGQELENMETQAEQASGLNVELTMNGTLPDTCP